MLAILRPRPAALMRKVRVVFPIPLMVLIRVLLVYKKGHIHARICIRFPARLL